MGCQRLHPIANNYRAVLFVVVRRFSRSCARYSQCLTAPHTSIGRGIAGVRVARSQERPDPGQNRAPFARLPLLSRTRPVRTPRLAKASSTIRQVDRRDIRLLRHAGWASGRCR